MVIILLPIPFVETNELRPVRAGIEHIYYPLSLIQFLSHFKLVPSLLSIIRMPVRQGAPLSDFTNLSRQSRRISDVTVQRRLGQFRSANYCFYICRNCVVTSCVYIEVAYFDHVLLALILCPQRERGVQRDQGAWRLGL